MAADDVTTKLLTNANYGFKQFLTAVDIYATRDPLWPWTIFQ